MPGSQESHQNLAVRLHLGADSDNLFHDLIESAVLGIDGHLLHHEIHACIVDTVKFLDRLYG